MSYFYQREHESAFSGSSWGSQELHEKFAAIQFGERKKPGLVSYPFMPRSIDCSDWLGVFEELRTQSEENWAETMALMRPDDSGGYIQNPIIVGLDGRMSVNTKQYSDFHIAIHAHNRDWKELPQERQRDAKRSPWANDYLSPTDRIKIILKQSPWECFGAVHGRSVVFMLRSHDTPIYSLQNPFSNFYLMHKLLVAKASIKLKLLPKIFDSNMTIEEDLSHYALESNIRFAREQYAGLYHIPNYYYTPNAIRIG